ncbi:MAG: 5-bromo-4-chloroindolyl phosphate hydrolysis family protein [Thiohalocapsa sp.]|nr:5-bromo-4-chloroindolyl phosphate hydrolysis family protein [Thiohalocapsa sp.]MCF7991195.1 5-bromo-4-chloroindolyl phosphate hydrolysis family protein [Thiohalocapsa sp.]
MTGRDRVREKDRVEVGGRERSLDDLLRSAGDLTVRRPTQPAASARPARNRGAKRRRRTPILLWVLSSPLLLSAVTALAAGRLQGFVGDAAAWGLVAGGALLTARGFADAEAGRERRFSRTLRLPLKNIGAAFVGAGTAVAALLGIGHTPAVSLAFGAVAVLGFHFAYGLEPLVIGRRLEAPDKESRAVADALADAERRLLNIDRAAAAIGNPELRQRLARIADQGRGMLDQIAARPSDLRRARRFLTVFLEGAEQVTDGYVRTHRYADSDELEQNFRNVLVTIEDQFARQRERLRQADVLDLDVQIEVLKKQLEQEGIR